MTKLKKTKISFYASLSVSVLVVIVCVGIGVNAFSGQNNGTVMESVTIQSYNASPEMIEPEGNLSAMASPDISSPYLSVNGDRMWHVRGDMIDASTTLVAIDLTSYGLTMTASTSPIVAELVKIRIDAVATTSAIITCGAAVDLYSAVSYNLMITGEIATSTGAGCILENHLLTADNAGGVCADGGSVDKISLSPQYPIFKCTVAQGAGTAGTGGFTGDANTFDGDYLVRFTQMQ